MSHKINFEDLNGFEARHCLAMSTADNKRLFIVTIAGNSAPPSYEIRNLKGKILLNPLTLRSAIEQYNSIKNEENQTSNNNNGVYYDNNTICDAVA
nr:hypothetical protein [uncultured Flavobacterium sp.]